MNHFSAFEKSLFERIFRGCVTGILGGVVWVSLWSVSTLAQSGTTIVMPLKALRLDPALTSSWKADFTTANSNLRRTLSPGGASLATQSPAPLTLNLQRAAADIFITNTPGPNHQAIYPVVCRLLDRYVAMIVVTELPSELIKSIIHQTVPAEPLNQVGRNLQQSLTRLANRLSAQNLNVTPSDSALTLGLAMGKQLTRQNQSPGQCMNLLLAGELIAKYSVINPIGGINRAVAERALKERFPLGNQKRASRQVVTRWQFARNVTLESNLKMTFSMAESVRGQRLFVETQTEVPVSAPTAGGGRITLSLPPELVAALDGEQEALRLKDNPKVVYKDRAWVFVDKGRAWGLKMRDRLVAVSQNPMTTESQPIKGHIVGFFGPKRGLKDANGNIIGDGAIIYIRQGQKNTKLGIELNYDPRKFPYDSSDQNP